MNSYLDSKILFISYTPDLVWVRNKMWSSEQKRIK